LSLTGKEMKRVRWNAATVLLASLFTITSCGLTLHPSASQPAQLQQLTHTLQWVRTRTRLPVYAPTQLFPRLPAHIAIVARATATSYVIRVYARSRPTDGRPSQAPTSAEVQPVLSYSAVRVGKVPASLRENLLASFNLFGPAGMPPLRGRVWRNRPMVFYHPRAGVIWWRQRGWVFWVQARTTRTAWKQAEALAEAARTARLPGQAGLVVAAPAASAVDWFMGSNLLLIEGGLATPREVLAMATTMQRWPVRSATR
jgi:hypothetical protein